MNNDLMGGEMRSESVRKAGGAGDSPAPVPDTPGLTGSAERQLSEGPLVLARSVALVPSGESPDATGGAPVLPRRRPTWLMFSSRVAHRAGGESAPKSFAMSNFAAPLFDSV